MGYEDGLTDNTAGWKRYRQRIHQWLVEDPKEKEELERRLCRGGAFRAVNTGRPWPRMSWESPIRSAWSAMSCTASIMIAGQQR